MIFLSEENYIKQNDTIGNESDEFLETNIITIIFGLLDAHSEHPHVFEIRQRGLMVGIELVKERSTQQPFEPHLRMGHQVIVHARSHGVILRPLGDVVVLMPPLAITDDQLEELVKVTFHAIDHTTGIE